MSAKLKHPWKAAMELAEQLKAALEPMCEAIEIAGSLRRRKALVSDIELLYIPRFESRKVDLFDSAPVSLVDEGLATWLRTGVLTKRLSMTGITTWGEKNKLSVHVGTGIPVDFFATTRENWFVSLVIRTGSKETNLRLTTGANALGRSLNAYGSGVTINGQVHPATSERDVFNLCGVPYLEPEQR